MTNATGTCPACFRSMAVEGGKIVRHGWTEQGQRRVGQYGNAWHTGQCFGAGWSPFEVSPAGTVAYVTQAVWPEALAAANEIARLAGMPRLVVSIDLPRKWDGRRYVKRAPMLADRLPGDEAGRLDSGDAEVGTVRVPAYAHVHAQQLAAATAWSTSVCKLGADLDAKIAAWRPSQLTAARGPVVHLAAARGTHCDRRNFGALATADRAHVTCSRCLKMLAASDEEARALAAVVEDVATLTAWLRKSAAPATKSEIKKALGWDTKRVNAAIERAERAAWRDGPRAETIRSVYRPGKPDAFAVAAGA